MSNHSVYISYSRHDSTFATDLYDYLKKVPDVNVVMDNYQLNLEKLLTQQKKHMDQSEKVVILLSPEALNEKKIWILLDNIGFSKAKISAKYICCIIKPCKIPTLLQSFDCVDFSQMNVNPYEQLFRLLNVPHETNISDHAFTNEIKELYQDYFPKEGNDQIDFIVDHQRLGFSHQALVKCVSVEIDRMIAYEIIAHFMNVQKEHPGFKSIVISKHDLPVFIKELFHQNGMNILPYGELLEGIVPLKPYLHSVIETFSFLKDETWIEESIHIYRKSDSEQLKSAYKDIERWRVDPTKNVLFLVGEVNTGKTLLMKYLSYRLARAYQKVQYQIKVPVFIDLSKEKATLDLDSLMVLLHKNGFKHITLSQFIDLCMRGTIILLIDHFFSDNAFDIEGLITLLSRFKRLKIMFSCRPETIEGSKTIENYKYHEEIKKYEKTFQQTSFIPLNILNIKKIEQFSKNNFTVNKDFLTSPLSPDEIRSYWKKLNPLQTDSELKKLKSILIRPYHENVSENALLLLYWKSRINCEMEENVDSNNIDQLIEETKKLIPNNLTLNGADLKGVELVGICFDDADLSYTDLSNANLSYASLINAKMIFTKCSKTIFKCANLENADFSNANIDRANFKQVKTNDKTIFIDIINSTDEIDINLLTIHRSIKPVVQNLGHCNRSVSTHKHIKKRLSASGGADGLVLIYDSSEYRILWALEGHAGVVNMVMFSHQGYFLASSSSDRTIRLWDVHTGNIIHVFDGYDTPVSCIAFSNNDQFLASTSDNQIVIWDLKNKEKIVQQMVEPMITELLFPDHETLYAKDIDDVTWQWKISDSKLIHLDAPDSIEFPQGNDDWLKAQTGHQSGILSLAISPHGQFLASANMNGTICIWDLKNGCLKLWLKGHNGIVSGLSFIDNNTLISCGNDETIRKWNMHTGESLRFWHGHNNYINDIAYSPHSQYIATASNDRTIALWDTDANLFTTLNKHTDWVRTLCFSNDGKLLASGGRDNKVILWDLLKRKLFYDFKGHEDEITALQFTDNQKYLISASLDRTIRVWHLESKTCQNVLQGHKEGIRSLSFVQNNELVSGGRDNTIRLWDIHSGECHAILENNMGQVNSICFTPNKRVLISAGDAGRIQLWDYKRKKCLIWMYAFSKDDWMLLTPDGDYDANGKALSYLGYTEQDTLTYTKASNMKESFKQPEKIEKIFQQYF
jgi:WD40 repeat protein